MNINNDFSTFSAMQEGNPVGSYKKTVPSKVHVVVMNPFSKEPEGLILFGEPNAESSIVRTWSLPEDLFFKRMNRRHFEQGVIIPFDESTTQPLSAEKALEQSSDEEVTKMVKSKFLALQAIVTKTNSEAFLNRLLSAARAEDASEKYVNLIQNRLAEVQLLKTQEE